MKIPHLLITTIAFLLFAGCASPAKRIPPPEAGDGVLEAIIDVPQGLSLESVGACVTRALAGRRYRNMEAADIENGRKISGIYSNRERSTVTFQLTAICSTKEIKLYGKEIHSPFGYFAPKRWIKNVEKDIKIFLSQKFL